MTFTGLESMAQRKQAKRLPVKINKVIKREDVQEVFREVVGEDHGAKIAASSFLGIARPTLDLWLTGTLHPVVTQNIINALVKYGYEVEEEVKIKTPEKG